MNKPIVTIFPIWELRTHEIKAIVSIGNIDNALLDFVGFK